MSADVQTAARTQLVRDRSGERTMYIGAAVCAAVSVGSFLLVDHWGILWLSIPTALLAAASLAAGRSGCYDGQCPACGAELSPVNFKQVKPTACKQCRAYYEGSQGWLSVVEADRVADEPVFCSPLTERMAFPNCCAVCGAAATRYDKAVGSELHAAKLLIGTLSTTKVSLDGVPYCGRHTGGVDLDTKHIRFRSYLYMRAFCELNGLVPGPAKSFWDELDEQTADQQTANRTQPERVPVAELVEDEEWSEAVR